MSAAKRRDGYRPPRDRREVATAVIASLAVVVVTAVLIWVLRPNKDSGSSPPPATVPPATTIAPASTSPPTETTGPSETTPPAETTAPAGGETTPTSAPASTTPSGP